ncbi:MAG TPA: hypothetical protein VFY39_13560 [Gammaproteobacteria bacterium]|nr:hypothetical protein [Gammaproteobacteria bacterium]
MKRRKDEHPKPRKHPAHARRRFDGDEGRVASVEENRSGAVDFDELGRARWKWITESEYGAGAVAEDTFDYLKALDNVGLSVADEPGAAHLKAPPGKGYDPYDTPPGRLKSRRRG